MQYWSAIVYNAEVAVKFSELPCIQKLPRLTLVDSMQMLRRRLVPRLHAALEQVLRTWRQGATF